MNPGSFFSELKRRNVYKVAVTYAVVGWLLVQVATQVFPFFEIPNWGVRLVVLLVVAGFPVALILAWAFELTPEGIKRTDNGEQGRVQTANRAWIYIVIFAGAISIGLFFLGRYTAGRGSEPSEVSEKSIAVLPFENLSDDKANAYFATGIQEEIMTRLAKIADLKVISRTSTQQYQSKPGNLSQIAKELGVAHVLEGSVQKVGEQVRVNVQLIKADHDAHLWAETYDRKLTDIFGVESDVAKSIAQSLQAKLTGREEEAFAGKPTNNSEAYDAYLRGVAAESESLLSVYPLQKAISFYKRAVHLDPNFALAWARLSRMYSLLYSSFGDRLGDAKGALEHAQALQPEAPETLLALAFYQNDELRDYEQARETFLRVARLAPGNSEIPASLASIARREGQWDKVTEYSEQALALDPRNSELLTRAAFNYGDQRQFLKAILLLDRALQVRPDDLEISGAKALMYEAEGNLTEANKYVADINALTPSYEAVGAKLTQLRLERKSDEAIELLKTRFAQFQFGSEVEEAVFKYFLVVEQYVAGDKEGAQASAAQSRDRLVQLTREQPDNDWLAVMLSQTHAVLGDRNAAWKEADRVKTITSSPDDAAIGPFADENVALVATFLAEKDRALDALSHLARIPYSGWIYGCPITPALLRNDPIWDSLRSEPTFQELCQDKER